MQIRVHWVKVEDQRDQEGVMAVESLDIFIESVQKVNPSLQVGLEALANGPATKETKLLS